MPLRVVSILVGLSLAASGMAAETATSPKRVAVIHWGIAQTVLALGVEPVAIADVPLYRKWVSEPSLPENTGDLGRRLEPSLTALAGVEPDLVLMSGHYEQLRRRVERIAPVETHTLYEPGGDALERAIAMADRLAERLDRERQRHALEDHWNDALDALRERGGQRESPSVYVVQFQDAGHVRVFGKGSLYQGVLERAGLTNAWQGETTFWGFALVEIARLDAAADLLLVIDPVPARAEAMMRDSAIWQALPAVRHGRVRRLEPTWSFGSLPSAIRFAEQLHHALDDD